MLRDIIFRVITAHPDFSYEEVEEVCQIFLASITEKMKEETKIKRLVKYIEKEFELDTAPQKNVSNKIYTLETIPEYLFKGKGDILSSLVTIRNLSKNIEQTELFQSVDMQINRNDKIALIGKNGSWKTTLLKMIIDRDIEYDGIIEKAAKLKIWYLSQDLFWQDTNNTLRQEMLMVFPDITEKIHRLEEIQYDDAFWEEIEDIKTYLQLHDGYKRYELQLDILKYFGFRDEQFEFNVLQLSWWEQTKVQIAKFMIMEVDLLILDEPTNHLDIEGIIFLEHFCKIWKKAIVSISHDVRFINNTSDSIIEISEKKLNRYPGGYENYLIEKQARYDKQLKSYEIQQKELEKQEAYINRFRYQASKAAWVQSRIKQVAKIERIERPHDDITVRKLTITTDKRLPEKVLELRDVHIGYEVPIIITSWEIVVRKDDKIGIIGRNWAGKTTLLKTILSEILALSWTIYRNPDIIIGSYSQVLSDLDGELSIIAELLKNHQKDTEIRSMLGWLLLSWDKVDQKIKTLSGGERAKVALTKMLLTKPHVIVMDEPTNHLDLHSKNVIKEMLENFNGTSIIVSHDRDLLEHISNKVWLIQEWKLRTFDDPEKGFQEVF